MSHWIYYDFAETAIIHTRVFFFASIAALENSREREQFLFGSSIHFISAYQRRKNVRCAWRQTNFKKIAKKNIHSNICFTYAWCMGESFSIHRPKLYQRNENNAQNISMRYFESDNRFYIFDFIEYAVSNPLREKSNHESFSQFTFDAQRFIVASINSCS